MEDAQGVADTVREARLRSELDDRSERMNAKSRDAQLQKVPYMLVKGDREIEVGQVSVRLRSEENLGAMSIEGFLERAKTDIEEKK